MDGDADLSIEILQPTINQIDEPNTVIQIHFYIPLINISGDLYDVSPNFEIFINTKTHMHTQLEKNPPK